MSSSDNYFTLYSYSVYGASYTKPTSYTARISAVITYPSLLEINFSYPLKTSGFLMVNRTLNITTSSTSEVFNMMH